MVTMEHAGESGVLSASTEMKHMVIKQQLQVSNLAASLGKKKQKTRRSPSQSGTIGKVRKRSL